MGRSGEQRGGPHLRGGLSPQRRRSWRRSDAGVDVAEPRSPGLRGDVGGTPRLAPAGVERGGCGHRFRVTSLLRRFEGIHGARKASCREGRKDERREDRRMARWIDARMEGWKGRRSVILCGQHPSQLSPPRHPACPRGECSRPRPLLPAPRLRVLDRRRGPVATMATRVSGS